MAPSPDATRAASLETVWAVELETTLSAALKKRFW